MTRSTRLNMKPVAGVHPTVATLYARCAAAGLSMRQLCEMAQPPVHHDVPARWRRGDAQPTIRVLQRLLDALEFHEEHDRHMNTPEMRHMREQGLFCSMIELLGWAVTQLPKPTRRSRSTNPDYYDNYHGIHETLREASAVAAGVTVRDVERFGEDL